MRRYPSPSAREQAQRGGGGALDGQDVGLLDEIAGDEGQEPQTEITNGK